MQCKRLIVVTDMTAALGCIPVDPETGRPVLSIDPLRTDSIMGVSQWGPPVVFDPNVRAFWAQWTPERPVLLSIMAGLVHVFSDKMSARLAFPDFQWGRLPRFLGDD